MFKKHKNKENHVASEPKSESPARSLIRKLLPWKASQSKDVIKQHKVNDAEPFKSSTTVSTLMDNQHLELPPASNNPGAPIPVVAIAPKNAEREMVQRTWKSGLSEKGAAILRMIGEIAGVSTVDALGHVEREIPGKTIGEFCAVLSGSISSLMDKNGSNIPDYMMDSFTSLCSDLTGVVTNIEKGSINAEDARWKVTNLLQMVLLENNLAGYISLDVYGKILNHLTNIQDKETEDSLVSMWQAVTNLPSVNAAYNDYASTCHRRVTCLEGTRQELLKEVGEWAAKSESNIYVLFGLAGIGKSTIAQTIAKSADSIGLLGASFFFSRDDSDRRTAKLFFTTIAFQLCAHDKEFADAIGSVLKGKGKTVTAKLPLEQLEALILEPLARLSPRKVVIVIDALDECDDEEGPTVLMGLHSLVQHLPSFKVILTTRPQPYIQFHLEGQESHKIFHLHNIDDKTVDGDIRRYLKHHLSTKAVQTHFKSVKEDWNASDVEIELLVQAAGRLFIIASTSVLFILDKTAQAPEYRMKVLLEAIAHERTPFDALRNFYTVILRSALPKGSDSYAIERYQAVIGAIIIIQTPLGIETLAKLIESKPRDIYRVLEKLQSVILVDHPSDMPRIYHKSFPDYIQDSGRCVDDDLRIDPKSHHTQVAMCCFRTMTRCLKQNILELGDPACFMDNDSALKEQGITNDRLQEKISLDLQYACLHFANHIEGANTEDMDLLKELQAFTNARLLNWFETLSWIGKLDSAFRALLIVQKHMKSASPDVRQLLSDGLRFIGQFYIAIQISALHTYHSALPFTPTKTSLYHQYSKQMSPFCQVQGRREEWDAMVFTLNFGEKRVDQVIFSVDNTMLACHAQSELTIHDATATGVQIATIKGKGIAIARDFSKAAASENNIITLYRVKGVTPVAIIKASVEVRHLELSPDGSRMLAVLADGTISVWDTEEGKLMMTSARWRGRTISVASSNVATGTLAITLDNDTSIFVFDVSSCDIVATLDCSVIVEEALSVSVAGFSGDGSRLACFVATSETSTLILWESKDGTLISAAQQAGKELALSNDGSLVATWEGKTLNLWNGVKGDPLLLFKTLHLPFRDEITSVAFAQNDLLVAASHDDDQVILYDTRSHSFLPKIHLITTTAISFSLDCTRLATGSYDCGIVHIWDVPSIKAQEQLSSPTALSFSPDCSWLASGHEDGSIKLWDTSDTTVPVSTRKGHLKKITALVFNLDGGGFASGSEEGLIGLWDVRDDVQDGTLECCNEQISALAMSRQLLVAATETRITLYDIKTRSVTGALDQSNTFRLTVSNDCSLLAIAFNRNHLIVWDIMTRRPLTTFDHTYDEFGRMAFTNGNSKLATQDNDWIKLFNIRKSDQEDFKWRMVSDSQAITQLGFLPCWHGVPVCVNEYGNIIGLFPQQSNPVAVLFLPWGHYSVQCGSSMIAYGHRSGSIFLVNAV